MVMYVWVSEPTAPPAGWAQDPAPPPAGNVELPPPGAVPAPSQPPPPPPPPPRGGPPAWPSAIHDSDSLSLDTVYWLLRPRLREAFLPAQSRVIPLTLDHFTRFRFQTLALTYSPRVFLRTCLLTHTWAPGDQEAYLLLPGSLTNSAQRAAGVQRIFVECVGGWRSKCLLP